MGSMDNFRERFEALEQRTEHLQQHIRTVERRLRWWRGIACGLGLLGLVSLPLQSGTAADTQPKGVTARLAAVEQKLSALTFNAAANEVVITGANLRIVNGLGSTERTNGLGNLIVGYNESRDGATPPDNRTGSHNVVVGVANNFSSFGGLVVGNFNTISGGFASVSGGDFNTASGPFSSVSGGTTNTASGNSSSVSGGSDNSASGDSSSVSGGGNNTASSVNASVSGGQFSTASGVDSSVSGGEQNTASGWGSSVSGGKGNTASGGTNTSDVGHATVSGGENNTASGDFSSVSGGANRTAPAQDNWAAGALFSNN
jgi:hypothetical protein